MLITGVKYTRNKSMSTEEVSSVLTMNEYIMGVLAAINPPSTPLESLKAQTIVIRTVLYKEYIDSLEQNKVFNAALLQLPYVSLSSIEDAYSKDEFRNYYSDIVDAVSSTTDRILLYDGETAQPMMHVSNNGKTRDYEEVYGESRPYLISINSEKDQESPDFKKRSVFQNEYLCTLLKENFQIDIGTKDIKDKIRIETKDSAGYVVTITIGDKKITGEEFAKCLSLNSTCFLLDCGDTQTTIISSGRGDGFGLSCYGASCMANEGKEYLQILDTYFPGTTIERKELKEKEN